MNAKEMFEELGYILYKTKNGMWLCAKDKKYIDNINISDKVAFNLLDKKIYYASCVDLKLNKAIQKQIEELGWLDE